MIRNFRDSGRGHMLLIKTLKAKLYFKTKVDINRSKKKHNCWPHILVMFILDFGVCCALLLLFLLLL